MACLMADPSRERRLIHGWLAPSQVIVSIQCMRGHPNYMIPATLILDIIRARHQTNVTTISPDSCARSDRGLLTYRSPTRTRAIVAAARGFWPGNERTPPPPPRTARAEQRAKQRRRFPTRQTSCQERTPERRRDLSLRRVYAKCARDYDSAQQSLVLAIGRDHNHHQTTVVALCARGQLCTVALRIEYNLHANCYSM